MGDYMLDKAELLKAYIFDSTVSPFSRRFLKQLDFFLIKQRRKDYKRKYLNVTETHALISASIKDNKAFMLGRLGNTERHIVAEYVLKKYGIRKKYSKKWKEWLLSTSGFFLNGGDTEEQIDDLADLLLHSMSYSDLQGVWDYDFEALLVNEYAPNAVVTNANNTLIYSNVKNSWGLKLEGKKVLFVSPFEKSIINQYPRLSDIWGEYHLLGKFELLTYKSPYTAAGNNPKDCTWFDIYNRVVKEIKEKEFDVAILGCGIYGYPLSAEIKKMGKIALQMCGETQIIMGITGKRWEDGGYIDEYKNEYWIYPIDERPSNFKSVEGGCYW